MQPMLRSVTFCLESLSSPVSRCCVRAAHRHTRIAAETEMKEPVQQPLDEPGALAEHRLLARLDETSPPKLLAGNVEHAETGQAPLRAAQGANTHVRQNCGYGRRRQCHPRTEQGGGEERSQNERAAHEPCYKRLPSSFHQSGQQSGRSQPKQQWRYAELENREPNANTDRNRILLSAVHLGLLAWRIISKVRRRNSTDVDPGRAGCAAAVGPNGVELGSGLGGT